MPTLARPRRTQAERASAMRHRLLEATIECLVEFGYANTTTTRVVERAGVTRGAQVHHFPTKAALVAAAIRHLAQVRAERALAELDRIRTAPDPVDAALDLLWDLHQGPVFQATVELWVAARTDPELRQHLSEVEPETTSPVLRMAAALFADGATRQAVAHWAYTAMDTIRGIQLTSFAFADPAAASEPESLPGELPGAQSARWQRAKGHLKAAAPRP